MKNAKSVQKSATLTLEQVFQQANACQMDLQLQEDNRRYRAILKSQPDNLEANYYLGALAVQMKQPSAGLPYFVAALNADPTRGQCWSSYIDALIQADQLEDARQVLTLAQMHWLQGADVDQLELRLQSRMPASNQAILQTILPQDSKPSLQEINKLVDLFTDWRYPEAVELARSLTVRFPSHPFGWKALGAVLKQLGRSLEALAPMQKAAELSPGDVEAHYNLGVNLQDLERLSEAEVCYRQALQINPDYAPAHSNLGVILHDLGRLDEALTSYRTTLQINPDDAATHSNLGVNLHDLGRLSEAEASLRRGLELNPGDAKAFNNLGNTLLALGKQEEAITRYQQALQLKPHYADAHYNLGNALRVQNRSSEAEANYRLALKIKPEFAQAHYNLGITLQDLDRLEEAEASYRRALQLKPDYAEAHYNLGNTLHQQNRPEAAVASYRQALLIKPDYAEAHYNLGNTLKQLDRPDEAASCYNRALQINQQLAEAYCNLGSVLNELKRLDEAEANYRKALLLKPDYATAHNNLGNTLSTLGRLEEAIQSYQNALLHNPNFAEAHSNLGVTLKDLHRPEEACASLRRAVQLNPDLVVAHNNLGSVLCDLGLLEEACTRYQRALQLKPDYAEAYNNLGATFNELKRLEEAETCYLGALKIKPDFAEAHCNRSTNLMAMGRLAEAESCCRQSLAIAPDYAAAHQNLANVLAYLSEYTDVVAHSDAAMRLAGDSVVGWEQRLYTFSYHPDLGAPQIYAEFVRWGDRFADPVVDFSQHDRTLGRRLRIGYVSPDFRRHTSNFFFWPLFANHNHAVVELYAYSNVKFEDDITRKMKGVFEHWRDIRGVSDSEVARIIREDKIDILIDACNHMRDDRLGVFTLKPAPIQATWLGAAWTTGLKTVDYALIDPYMAPQGTLTRETIVRLPHCFVSYCPPDKSADILPSPCLANGYITYGYSGRTERLNHHTFRVWGEILRKNLTARMILDYRPFADPPTQVHYRQLMTRLGMDASRVTMRCSTNIFDGLNDIDILLDCFPHSGGTMSMDALWMGVPVLTLAGRPPVGRIGTSLMINLGMPEWVAQSQQEYIAKACSMAQDHQALAKLRAGMRTRMQNSPLMDGPGFTREMESSFQEMFEKWVKGTDGDKSGNEGHH